MTQIQRTYVWKDFDDRPLNQELENIISNLNNYDSGNSTWSNLNASSVTAGTITATTQLIGKGTATNDSAAAGYIGEYVESKVTVYASVGTSGQYFDMTTLALTPGDWDISASCIYKRNGATYTSTDNEFGIGTATGNSTAGLIDGTNYLYEGANAPTTFSHQTFTIPVFRVSITTNTTYYLKGYTAVYTVGTPQYVCRISARRVR